MITIVSSSIRKQRMRSEKVDTHRAKFPIDYKRDDVVGNKIRILFSEGRQKLLHRKFIGRSSRPLELFPHVRTS